MSQDRTVNQRVLPRGGGRVDRSPEERRSGYSGSRAIASRSERSETSLERGDSPPHVTDCTLHSADNLSSWQPRVNNRPNAGFDQSDYCRTSDSFADNSETNFATGSSSGLLHLLESSSDRSTPRPKISPGRAINLPSDVETDAMVPDPNESCCSWTSERRTSGMRAAAASSGKFVGTSFQTKLTDMNDRPDTMSSTPVQQCTDVQDEDVDTDAAPSYSCSWVAESSRTGDDVVDQRHSRRGRVGFGESSAASTWQQEFQSLLRENDELSEANKTQAEMICRLRKELEDLKGSQRGASRSRSGTGVSADDQATKLVLLQEQVEVYKEDFDNERRDKERAIAEKNSLAQQTAQLISELRVARDQNIRLQRELDGLRRQSSAQP